MYVWILLIVVAAFHLILYYWNMDFPKQKKIPNDLNETKDILENHLKELRQYSHG